MSTQAEGNQQVAKYASIQSYARAAGLLLLLSVIAGFIGEFYVPNKMVVAGDATATAKNVITQNFLFRVGFACYLIEAVCDVALGLIFYVLLAPVQKHLALLSACFGLISTALYAVAELFYYSAGIILNGSPTLNVFTPAQLNAFAMLSLRVFGSGAGVFMVFYGIACVLRGILMFRSTYLPKFLGVLVALAGFGFIAKTFVQLLAPKVASDLLLAPMFVTTVFLTGWFLVKGVDLAKWNERTAHA